MHSTRLPVPPKAIEMDDGGSLVVGLGYMEGRFLKLDEWVAVLVNTEVVTVEVEAGGVI